MSNRPKDLSLRDSRWLRGVEPFKGLKENDDQPLTRWDNVSSELSSCNDGGFNCSTCGCSFDLTSRDLFVAHYRSDWHRHNIRLLHNKRSPLTEERFEELAGSDGEISVSSDSEDEMIQRLAPTRAFFCQDGDVFSCFRAVLHNEEEEVGFSLFTRSIDCAIFIISGGYFGGAVFKNDQMVLHKTIARYVVRAKQGGAQSANDNAKGAAHSAGAALRRYGERTLRSQIADILQHWSSQLEDTPLIFIRSPVYMRNVFHCDHGFAKNDLRLRNIPFETKRPTIPELNRAFNRLSEVRAHGTHEEYIKELETKRKRPTALMKKKKNNDMDFNFENDLGKEIDNHKERKSDHLKKVVEQPPEEDPWPALDHDLRQKLYEAVRYENVDILKELLARNDLAFNYLSNRRFLPNQYTFLHLAAANGLDSILMVLLEIGCDPSQKDSQNLVPYMVSKNKPTRKVFMQFRKNNPKAWDWNRCRIPELVEQTDEQLQQAAEKKKEKKQRQREKLKEKKEQERKEAEEEAARAEWLALPEREKRARAAEARLAAQEANKALPRCVQCATTLPEVPFEYKDVRLCSPKCVAAHRAAFP